MFILSMLSLIPATLRIEIRMGSALATVETIAVVVVRERLVVKKRERQRLRCG